MLRKRISRPTRKGGRPNSRPKGKSASLDQWFPSEMMTTVGSCIVPQRMSTVLRWQNVNNAMSTATVQYSYVALTLNGAYDPLYTLGGGSCTGFRELMSLYNRYIVDKVHIRASITNASSNSTGNTYVGFILEVPSDQTAIVGTPVSEDLLEARRATTQLVPRSDAFEYRTLERVVDVCQLEGLPTLVADYANLSGTQTGNPNRTPVALVGVVRPTGPQASTTAEMIVTMEFHITLYQPTQFTTA